MVKGEPLRCPYCGHFWFFRGKRKMNIICPHCFRYLDKDTALIKGDGSMKIVLWISRHRVLPAQEKVLKEKLGDNVTILTYSKPIPTDDFAVQLIKKTHAEIVIPVLPATIVNRLVEKSIEENYKWKVWIPIMELIHNCKEPRCPEYNPETDSIVESRDFDTGELIFRHYRFKKFVWRKRIIYEDEDV
jgi:hypothetical protein